MEMEGSYLQKKLSRNLPPSNTLNLKMKIPLYVQSPDKFWAGRWRRRNNPTHFVSGVVFCSSNQGATTVILSRDRVPGTNVVTGISRKLRGRSAEATGCVWEYLATLSLPQYQFPGDRLWFEPSITSPTSPYRITACGLNLASPNPALLNKFALNVRSGFGRITPKTIEIPFAEEPRKHLRRKRPRKSPGSTASENLPVVFAEVSRKVRRSSRAEASLFPLDLYTHFFYGSDVY